MNKCISISILNVKDINSFLNKIKEIKDNIDNNIKIENKLDIKIHFDVMDGKFVPNTGVDLKYIKLAKQLGMYADVHLMVKNPIEDGYIDDAISFGADNITIHQEVENFDNVIDYLNIKKNELKNKFGKDLSIGVSIKPGTEINVLENYKEKFDLLLVMSVEPGYGGQKFIEDSKIKIKDVKESYSDKNIQIDGGINFETIIEPLRNGCNEFVIGSYITSLDNDNIYDKIISLNLLNSIESLEKNLNVEFEKNILQIVPGGYGENDLLVGINTPKMRYCSKKWYKYLNTNILNEFICSKYHDYRKFAIFCLSNMVKLISDRKEFSELIEFTYSNIKYINNWDLTDEFGPNILGNYLLLSDKKEQKELIINRYISSDKIWTKRIGIVSLLTLIKKGNNIEIPLEICDIVLYENYHLYQKATGWVLREIYKKEPKILVEYLYKKNKDIKLPSILLSYACEKMSKQEKEYIRK